MEIYCEKIQTFCVLFVETILAFFLTERNSKLKNRRVSFEAPEDTPVVAGLSTCVKIDMIYQAKIWKRYLIRSLIILLSPFFQLNLKPFEFKMNAAAREIQEDTSNGGY